MTRILPIAFILTLAVPATAQVRPAPRPSPPPQNDTEGRWWRDPNAVRRLNLSPDQQSRMDAAYGQFSNRLNDLGAALQREERALAPLLNADRVDEARASVAIDRVAQARAELEKANGRLMLAFRRILSPQQWRTMQADNNGPPPGAPPR